MAWAKLRKRGKTKIEATFFGSNLGEEGVSKITSLVVWGVCQGESTLRRTVGIRIMPTWIRGEVLKN